MTEGVLYIASGNQYIEEAVESARSVKEHTQLPITLVADRDVNNPVFNSVIQADNFCYHYGDSVLQIPELPYDKTILLDTDTLISDSLEELFGLVDRFDIAASTIADGEFTLSDEIPASFPEYNTGVVVFQKNDETERFVNEWKERYREYLEDGIRMNQPAFREVLFRSNLRVATLPTEYNCRANFGGYLNSKVKILHGDFNDARAIMEKLNKYTSPRVFYNHNGSLELKRVETVNVR